MYSRRTIRLARNSPTSGKYKIEDESTQSSPHEEIEGRHQLESPPSRTFEGVHVQPEFQDNLESPSLLANVSSLNDEETDKFLSRLSSKTCNSGDNEEDRCMGKPIERRELDCIDQSCVAKKILRKNGNQNDVNVNRRSIRKVSFAPIDQSFPAATPKSKSKMTSTDAFVSCQEDGATVAVNSQSYFESCRSVAIYNEDVEELEIVVLKHNTGTENFCVNKEDESQSLLKKYQSQELSQLVALNENTIPNVLTNKLVQSTQTVPFIVVNQKESTKENDYHRSNLSTKELKVTPRKICQKDSEEEQPSLSLPQDFDENCSPSLFTKFNASEVSDYVDSGKHLQTKDDATSDLILGVINMKDTQDKSQNVDDCDVRNKGYNLIRAGLNRGPVDAADVAYPLFKSDVSVDAQMSTHDEDIIVSYHSANGKEETIGSKSSSRLENNAGNPTSLNNNISLAREGKGKNRIQNLDRIVDVQELPKQNSTLLGKSHQDLCPEEGSLISEDHTDQEVHTAEDNGQSYLHDENIYDLDDGNGDAEPNDDDDEYESDEDELEGIQEDEDDSSQSMKANVGRSVYPNIYLGYPNAEDSGVGSQSQPELSQEHQQPFQQEDDPFQLVQSMDMVNMLQYIEEYVNSFRFGTSSAVGDLVSKLHKELEEHQENLMQQYSDQLINSQLREEISAFIDGILKDRIEVLNEDQGKVLQLCEDHEKRSMASVQSLLHAEREKGEREKINQEKMLRSFYEEKLQQLVDESELVLSRMKLKMEELVNHVKASATKNQALVKPYSKLFQQRTIFDITYTFEFVHSTSWPGDVIHTTYYFNICTASHQMNTDVEDFALEHLPTITPCKADAARLIHDGNRSIEDLNVSSYSGFFKKRLPEIKAKGAKNDEQKDMIKGMAHNLLQDCESKGSTSVLGGNEGCHLNRIFPSRIHKEQVESELSFLDDLGCDFSSTMDSFMEDDDPFLQYEPTLPNDVGDLSKVRDNLMPEDVFMANNFPYQGSSPLDVSFIARKIDSSHCVTDIDSDEEEGNDDCLQVSLEADPNPVKRQRIDSDVTFKRMTQPRLNDSGVFNHHRWHSQKVSSSGSSQAPKKVMKQSEAETAEVIFSQRMRKNVRAITTSALSAKLNPGSYPPQQNEYIDACRARKPNSGFQLALISHNSEDSSTSEDDLRPISHTDSSDSDVTESRQQLYTPNGILRQSEIKWDAKRRGYRRIGIHYEEIEM